MMFIRISPAVFLIHFTRIDDPLKVNQGALTFVLDLGLPPARTNNETRNRIGQHVSSFFNSSIPESLEPYAKSSRVNFICGAKYAAAVRRVCSGHRQRQH